MDTCNYMHEKQWDVITHPGLNFNVGVVKAREWTNNFIP